MVRKILSCFPRSKWGPDVMVTEEPENLKMLEFDVMLGKKAAHETHLQEESEDALKGGVSLKTINKDFDS